MVGEVPGHGLVSLAAEGVVLPGLHRDLGPQRVHHRGGPLHVPDTGQCVVTSQALLWYLYDLILHLRDPEAAAEIMRMVVTRRVSILAMAPGPGPAPSL